MNTSNAFRSHLMQQFVSQARTQSRPPLALLGVFSDDNEVHLNIPHIASSTHTPPQSRYLSTNLSSVHTSPSFTSNVRRRHTDSEITPSSQTGHLHLDEKKHTFSSVSSDLLEEVGNSEESSSSSEANLAGAFQTMLQTRRTSGRLVPLKELPPLFEHEEDFWIGALDRAVQCGYQAPNHRRTEPFTFKRMIAPSEATTRLSEIAYHVDLRKQLGDKSSNDAFQHAQRKREKWSQIPAFLVTTVAEETLAVGESDSEYDQLPYVPPQTERALEDYASACAAVQNVLLSLHSEQIATKWVTGPVIQTPAFRNLVHLEETDRVVALIMVGAYGQHPTKLRRRKNRRPVAGDLLIDI